MDEEMWYLQTNNKLREEKEKESKELSFEEKFNNEIMDVCIDKYTYLINNIINLLIMNYHMFKK